MRLTIISLLLVSSLSASAAIVSGTVKSGKKALAGVTVSDGYNCVVTDKKGAFTLDVVPDANYVSVSTPAGYLPPVDSLNHPLFYLAVDPARESYDFNLIKNKRNDRRHAFMTQADIQVVAEEELVEYDRQVADARDHFKSMGNIDVFGLDCGDIVGDHPELYPSSLRHRAGLGFPVYHVMGNHDEQYYGRTHETSQKRFEQYFGPSNYSFNRGNVHYVAIDNCFYIGRDYFYMGYVDERTFRWLEQDLANVPAGSNIVLFMHIPLKNEAGDQAFRYDGKSVSQETVNANHLIELLRPYNVHMITGHQHWNRNVEHHDSLYEHNTAAGCGLWWQTEVCEDGTPRGYGVYRVDGDKFDWYFKSTGFDQSHQMRVYLPGETPEAPDDIVANVWNADSQWRIEWLEDGKVMGEMTRFTARDPLTVSLIADRSKLKYSWTSASPNPHMFRATPVNPSAKITVRATDRSGRVYEAEPMTIGK
ncbi:MAG: calcineurin-like phosphoesterase C-terminal domain-containing protein [Muribaculaceae bacterium]|nr:calcineurin-like phosphoesterase C-terminal domain-containing protein [Muribaculaceae bacterium]